MEIFRFIFSPIEENTYLLADESDECAILDCGCYNEDEWKELDETIIAKKLKPVLLLNTHCHLDHIFGNSFVLEKYNLRTLVSEHDEANRKNSVQHAMIFGMKMENPPEPEGFINDNQVIKFGKTELLALHVPGHSPGSIAFYSKNDNCVFSGDALFQGSIGRTDLPGGDYDTLLNSIRTRLLTLPEDTVVYPGHGNLTTIGKEMRTNPFLI